MGWWFGRKSAVPDARPFVPAWLTNVSEEEGFARSADGMAFQVRATWTYAMFNAGVWQVGDVRGSRLILGGRQVVGEQGDAIPAPSGGTTVDSEARDVIGQILGALRRHGLIDV